jgi:tRNA threonylcarbamoyladenosine modification (KEOPS) complex  Pcc1 subunit
MKAKATIRLKFPSEKHLKTVSGALLPEINRPVSTRANVTLEQDGAFLVLKVEAESTVALRATLNAYLRWIASVTNVIGALEKAS